MHPDVKAPAREERLSLLDLADRASAGVRAVWDARRTVLIFAGVGVAIGLLLAFGRPREYTAKMTILPYRNPASIGGLGGLAGFAALRMPGGSGGEQLITVDLYPEVSATLDFRVALAETPIRFSSLDTSMSGIRYFEEIHDPGLVAGIRQFTIGLPGLILTKMRGKAGTMRLADKTPRDTAAIIGYSAEFLQQINDLGQRLSITSDRKTGVLRIVAQMPDPYAAADLVRTAAKLLMERIIFYEARKATEQLRFLETQRAMLQLRFDRADRAYAGFLDQNRVLLSATAQIGRDRLERERNLSVSLLEQVQIQIEGARTKVSQDTPVFTVLDPVTVPPGPSAPRRARLLSLWTFVGMAGGVIVVLGQRVRKPTITI